MKKLILIDGNAIVHRAFHALPPFKTSRGELVNAVYGFSSMLLNLLNNEKPEYIAVSFDTKAKTFRHEEYEEYKATRVKAPDELYQQFARIREIVATFQIPIYEIDGFEADDVLGTLATQAINTDDLKTYIVTGDHDTLQLVSEKVNVLMPVKGFKEKIVYTPQKVLGKYGINPAQIPDLKGLQGDSSDNIKGVKGVGKKTATDLIQKYGSVENIYKNLDQLKGKMKQNLEEDHESAIFSKKLATIICDAPIRLNLDSCRTHDYDKAKLTQLFQELEFKSLLNKLNSFNNHSDLSRTAADSAQPTLF